MKILKNNRFAAFLKAWVIAVIIILTGASKAEGQCPGFTITEVSDPATFTQGNTVTLTYTIVNTTNVTYNNASIQITLPYGIAWVQDLNVFNCTFSGTSNLNTVVTYTAATLSANSGNTVKIEFTANVPCNASGSQGTQINITDNSPSLSCTQTLPTITVYPAPTLGATIPLAENQNINVGVQDIYFQVQNLGGVGNINNFYVNPTVPENSYSILSWVLTNVPSVPASYTHSYPGYMAVGSSDFSAYFSQDYLPPGAYGYLHMKIKPATPCVPGGGTYTFSYGPTILPNPPSPSCFSVDLTTDFNVAFNTPSLSATTIPLSPNWIYCDNTPQTVGFVYTNNGTDLANATPGNAIATKLQLLVTMTDEMGTVDPNTFAVNGVSIPNVVPIITPGLGIGVHTYLIDFTQLSEATYYGNNPVAFKTGNNASLQDLDGNGFLDDLSNVNGQNTFTLTVQLTPANGCPGSFSSGCGSQNTDRSPAVGDGYSDQCEITAYNVSPPFYINAAYQYQTTPEPSTFNMPTDMYATPVASLGTPYVYNFDICPEYLQTWSPASPGSMYDFNCPNGYHVIHVDLPYGFYLNGTSPLNLTPFTLGPVYPYTGSSYPIQPVATYNTEDCSNNRPPSIDITFTGGIGAGGGRLPLGYFSGTANTDQIPCITLPLYSSCGETCPPPMAGWKDFHYSLGYVCGGPGCSSCTDSLACASNAINVHGCGNCAPGLGFDIPPLNGSPPANSFTFVRTNLGALNKNQPSNFYSDCTPPSNGDIIPANSANINTGAAYPGDQVTATTAGSFGGTPNNYSNMYLNISYTLPPGVCADPNAYIFILDPSQNSTVTVTGITNPSYTALNGHPQNLSSYDLTWVGGNGNSPSQLLVGLPTNLLNLIQNDGQAESLSFSYTVNLVAKTSNAGGLLAPYNTYFSPGQHILQGLRADFIGVETPSGDTDKSCDTWGANFEMLQPAVSFNPQIYNGGVGCAPYTYFFANNVTEGLAANSQDDFPYEFRPFSEFSPSMTISFPSDYTFVSAQYINHMEQYGVGENGYQNPISDATATYPITPTNNVPGMVTLTGLNSSCWPWGDEKFYGALGVVNGIELTLQPTCTALTNPPPTPSFTVTTSILEDVQQTNHAVETDPSTQQVVIPLNNVSYPTYNLQFGETAPNLLLTAPSSVNITNSTFTMDFVVCNQTPGNFPPYSWMTIEPNNYFTISSATINDGNTTYTVNIDFSNTPPLLELGTLLNQCYTVTVTATLNSADCVFPNAPNPANYSNGISATLGFNCSGYPVNNNTEMGCSVASNTNVPFSINVYPSAIVLGPPNSPLTEAPTNPVDLCNGQFTYNFIISDPYTGAAGNPAFWMNLPPGLSIANASFTYPISIGNTATLALNPAGFINGGTGWSLNSLVAVPPFSPALNGLPGFNPSATDNNQMAVSITLQSSCNYTPGQPIQFFANGNDICGNLLPTQTFTNAPTMTDLTCCNTCTLTASITSQTNVGCFGGSSGSATVTANNGTVPYTYTWSDNNSQSNAMATGLTAGSYTVTVKDANGCTATASVIITQPKNKISVSFKGAPIVCNGGTTSINATVTGGTPAYTYNWAPGGQTTAMATNLTATTYTLTVTDANGCAFTATVNVSQPPAINPNVTTTLVGCNNNNGTATSSPIGGTPGYTYSWSPVGGTNSTASNLSVGTYILTVTDANGCSVTTAVTLIPTDETVSASITSSTNITCNGSNNGSATVTASGGNIPYTYSWTPAGGTNSTASNLSAGSYTVTVTDANGCSGTASVTIVQPSILTTTVAITQPTCLVGGCVNAIPTGGTPNYTYSWSDGHTTSPVNPLCGLSAGTYTVTVTDANGCTVTATATLVAPPQVITIITNPNPPYYECNAVTLTANVPGGYNYKWTPLLSGLTCTNCPVTMASPTVTTTYTVTADIGKFCTASATVTVTVVPPVTVTIPTPTPQCGSKANGSATAVVSGGMAPYAYHWTPSGQTTQTATGLTANTTYTVTVTDNLGCMATASVTLPPPYRNGPSVTTSVVQPACVSIFGGCIGSATANAHGGLTPYTYAWSPTGGTNSLASNLCPGTYTVTVTDHNGCVVTSSVTINAVQVMGLTTRNTCTCATINNGTASAFVSGGSPPWSFTWSPVYGTSNNISGLSAGTYTVTVRDHNGCTVTASTTVNICNRIIINTIASNPACYNSNDGSAAVSASGGNPPYTYLWPAFGVMDSAIKGLPTGNYTVSVTDANGCNVIGVIPIPSLPNTLAFNPPIPPKIICGKENKYSVAPPTTAYPVTYRWTATNTIGASSGSGNPSKITFNSPGGVITWTASVLLSATDSCIITDTLAVTCSTTHNSMKESEDTIDLKQVIVYPNPASSILNVETQLDKGEVENMCLYNSLGQRIRCQDLKDELTVIPIENLPSGLYYYRITNTNGDLIKGDKVVIIH